MPGPLPAKGVPKGVLAIVEVAVEYKTYQKVDEESIRKRVQGSLRRDGYIVNDITVTHFIAAEMRVRRRTSLGAAATHNRGDAVHRPTEKENLQ